MGAGWRAQVLLLQKLTLAFADRYKIASGQGQAGFDLNERVTVVTANPVSFQPILSWHGR